MATKFKKPNKKTTIALVVAIVILLIIAVTGTVAFLKDRGRTEAADLEKPQQDLSQTEETGNPEQNGNPEQGGNQEQGESPEQTEIVNPENGEQTQERQTTTVTPGTNNQNNGNATTRVDNIQETTIERVENVEIPERQISEGHYVGWTPMGLKTFNASSKVNVNDSKDIEISKQSVTKSGKNVVTRGEEITYTIFVKNISNKDITDVEVKDKIPEMTTYVDSSADNSAREVVENKKVVGIIWNLDILKAGEEITLSFKVTVNKDAAGVITNIAFANGEETEPVKNTVIEATKTVAIEGKENKDIAKVGDKLIYTITVKNTGNLAGVANVQDTKLKELVDNGILKVDEESQEIANKLIEGTTVDVPENAATTINFKAEVLKVDGNITNIAVVGEEKPEVTVDTYGLEVNKELSKIERDNVEINKDLPVKKGDVLTYTITVKNVGSVDIKSIDIIDNLPDSLKALGQKDFKNVKIKAGETIVKTIKTEVLSINGTIVNEVVVTDKENPDEPYRKTETVDTIDISINKTATLEKASKNNKEEYKNIAEIGDTIHYVVSVTNNGSIDLKGIKVVDKTMGGESTIDLAAGATNSEALKIDHIVVATDIENIENGKTTYIYNTAVATYEDTENPENNVKKEDTEKVEVRDEYEYTVEYYYDGTIDSSKTGNKTATYGDVISTYTDKNITGYKFEKTENLPLTVSEVAENNVIRVYYVRDTFEYTVEYYYDGTIDSSKTENKTATYGDVISTYTDKNITGYKFEKTENLPLTVSEVDANNVIRVYYVRDTFEYTVEYYYDGTIDSSKTENKTATYGDVISTYTDKNITGYKFEKTENLPLTVSEVAENNVIRVYYVRDTFEYTVEYYYDGTIDSSKTENKTATYGDVISTYTDKNITGYKFEKTENLPLTVSEVAENNVIKVYYVRDTFEYTVEYYYDGTIDSSKTENKTATYGDVISTYTDKNITGYKFEKTENLPLTVSEVAENNVIRVYYVRDTFKYTVEYYYDGTIDSSKTENKTATYGDVISTYTDKNITGYKFEKTENLPLTVSEVAENNVIKVYYVRDTFEYTVEYYYDGTIDSSKTENKTATYGDVISTYTDKNITGYKFEKTENLPLTVSEVAENNVIRVYYVRDIFEYTVEYYYDGAIDSSKTENKTATYGDVISTYTDKNITGYKFEKTENLPLTVSEVAENNVIKVYYVRDTFEYTVEYYYDGTIDSSKTENKTATYGDVISTYTDKNITGYKFEKTENLPLTVSEVAENNVIRVYYVRDTFEYTVEYYYDGTIDSSKTENKTATYGDVISTYTDKNITGYKFEKTENLPLTVSEVAENNVIRVYYVRDTFEYTVEYYYDGTIDSSKTENKTATYGDVISTYTDKNITGYKFEKTENLPLTVSEVAENNVIRVYYVKDYSQTKTLKYIVKYFKDGVEQTSETVTENIWVNSTQTTLTVRKSEINTVDKFGDAYKFVSTDPEIIPDTVVTESIINVYYVSKPNPEIQLTKTAIKDGEVINSIIYNPNSTNKFVYRLKVENTVQGSYPELIAGPKTVTDVLPAGIKALGTLPTGVTKTNVTVDNLQREKITWTVSNIGYGDNAKYVDIPVKIESDVFTSQEVDMGTQTSVLDINLTQDGKADKSTKEYDGTWSYRENAYVGGTVMNLFIRSAGATNKNDGYIYAGSVTVGNTKPTSAKYASSTYNTDAKIDSAIKSSTKLSDMLDDFVKANEDGTMSKYVNGGLPTKAAINANLASIYKNAIQLSDTQVVLWYCTNVNKDAKLERYYKISKNQKTLFSEYVTLPACSYHLDGIVVDITSLGKQIPTGAQVKVTNTAILDDLSSSTTISIYYKDKLQSSSSTSANVLSATLSSIQNDEINSENVDKIVSKIETLDTIETTTENKEEKTINETNTVKNKDTNIEVVDKNEELNNVDTSLENKVVNNVVDEKNKEVEENTSTNTNKVEEKETVVTLINNTVENNEILEQESLPKLEETSN